jgi:hypothetical protein
MNGFNTNLYCREVPAMDDVHYAPAAEGLKEFSQKVGITRAARPFVEASSGR